MPEERERSRRQELGNPRDRGATLPALLLACASCVGSPSDASSVRTALAAAHSAVVIIIDEMGWSDRATVTSLDALAAQGVTFNRFCTFPLCSPSRYAALFGRYPRRDGIGELVAPVYPGEAPGSPAPDRLDVSVFEALKPIYATALVGKWHLGRAATGTGADLLATDTTESGPFVQGADEWLAGAPSNTDLGPDSTGHYAWYRVDNERVTPRSTTYSADAQRDAFLSWWSGTSGPKFAVLAWSLGHAPFDTPPGMTPATGTRNKFLLGLQYLNGPMNAVLSAIDLSDTYVFAFGDNGTPEDARIVGSPIGIWKGSTAGNGPTFGGGVGTPLIVAGPGITAGATSARLVSVADIPATLFELLGVSSRGFEDSRSFADALGSWTGSPARSFVFSERYGPPANTDDVCIIRQHWKMRTVDPDGPGPIPATTRYYDLAADPFERTPATPPASVIANFAADLASLPARKP